MKLRIVLASTAIAIGTVVGIAAPAQASTPRMHGKCSVSEVGQFRHTSSGKQVRCTNTGESGVRWVPVAR